MQAPSQGMWGREVATPTTTSACSLSLRKPICLHLCLCLPFPCEAFPMAEVSSRCPPQGKHMVDFPVCQDTGFESQGSARGGCSLSRVLKACLLCPAPFISERACVLQWQ